ncbi:MAG: aminoacyl-tRNA hydrolase [Porticoccaceae bacterium]
MPTPVQLVVGLGNPGPQYQRTRHNAGADFVAALAQQCGVALRAESRFPAATARVTLNGRDVRLLIPSTFMNLSGQAVGPLAHFYAIAPAAILVAHDEIDLSPGQARFKLGGGHGGHNGLRDIIKSLGNNADFARLRIGVGHPGHASQVVDYVLRRAPPEEQTLIASSIDRALDALPIALVGDWEKAMTALHTVTSGNKPTGK